MPSSGTSNRTFTNVKKLCDKLNLEVQEINILKAVEGHLKDIGHDKATYDATYENAQARERTQILMDVANKVNGMVIGTGDMSELALGWATYNGVQLSSVEAVILRESNTTSVMFQLVGPKVSQRFNAFNKTSKVFTLVKVKGLVFGFGLVFFGGSSVSWWFQVEVNEFAVVVYNLFRDFPASRDGCFVAVSCQFSNGV